MSKEAAMALATGNTPTTPVATEGGTRQAPPPTPALASTPFNALARKEAEFVKRQEAFKAEKAAVLAEKLQYETYNQKFKEFEETRAKDPIAAFKMAGFSETEIFNYLAAQEKKELTVEERAAQAASEAADAKIKAYEDGLAKKAQEAQATQDKELIDGYKSELGKTVQANPDKFKYCEFHGPAAEDLMYETAIQVLKDSNGADILTPQEAAQMVEEYYEGQDKEMERLRRPPTPSAPETTVKESERSRVVHPSVDPALTPKPMITKTRTLTNAATSTVASARHNRNETREQKRERLMEALRNGVKI